MGPNFFDPKLQFFLNFLNLSSTFSVCPQLSQFVLNFLSFSSTFSIFWAQTCSTHNLPSPNFFEPSVPGSLRIFQAFASLFELQFPVVYKMSKSIFDPHIAKENLRFQNLQSKKRSYLTHISQKKYLSHPMCRNTIV